MKLHTCKSKCHRGQQVRYQCFTSQLGVHPERDWQVWRNHTWLAWKCSKLNWKHKPWASSLTAKFWTFWRHFYGWKEYRTWKIIIVDWQFSCPFPLKFLKNIECTRKRKLNCATITSYQGLYSYQTWPLTNQSLRDY